MRMRAIANRVFLAVTLFIFAGCSWVAQEETAGLINPSPSAAPTYMADAGERARQFSFYRRSISIQTR